MQVFLKFIFPYVFSALLALVTYFPYDMGVFGILRIDFAMIALFFWHSQQDDSLSYIFVFVLGTLVDVLSDSVLGIHTIAYLSMYLVILYAVKQRVFSAVIGWYVSGVFGISIAYGIIWIGAVIKNTSSLYDFSYLYSAGLTIGAFPIAIFLFNKIIKIMRWA